MCKEEMLTHVAINTHNNPSKVLVLSTDLKSIKLELEKYKSFTSFEVTYVENNYDVEVQKLKDGSYDVIIADIKQLDKLLAYRLESLLTNKGVLVKTVDDILNLKNYENLKNYNILMPYRAENFSFLLASKYYHPTADVVLFRTDLLDNLDYYNTDIHSSSFILPNFIKSKLVGYVKN